MPKNKAKKYEEEILQVIKDKKILRFDHIFLFYKGCCRTTGYEHNLNESDAIKEALENNRMDATNYMLQKWIASNNPTLQIAAMRAVGPEDIRQKLNQQYIDHTTQGEKLNVIIENGYKPENK